MKLKKIILVSVGCLSLAIGCVGIVLPFLPTFPFFLLTAVCFAKSSERLNSWFKNTRMYKKHLESYIKKKGMTVKTKLTVILTVTLVMGFGFIMMSKVPVARMVLALVWAGHVAYFIMGVKTLKLTEGEER